MSTKKRAKKTGRELVVEGVRQQLLALIGGDAPLNTGTLRQIEAIARQCSQLLMASATTSELCGARGFNGSVFTNMGMVANPMSSQIPISSTSGSFGEDDGSDENTMAPSSPAENFGARAIREGISALTEIVRLQHAPSLEATVAAISRARESGMPELANRLTANLLGVPAGTLPAQGIDPGKSLPPNLMGVPTGITLPVRVDPATGVPVIQANGHDHSHAIQAVSP